MLGYWIKAQEAERAEEPPGLLPFNSSDSPQAAAACWSLLWHHTGMLP